MVASLAMTTHSRPLTRPMPVMMLAECTSPPYMPCAANGESSRNGLPGSSSRPMRSRASNFPRATCRARASSLPPCIAASSLPRRSATRAFIASALRANSVEPGSIADVSAVIAARSARLIEQLPADQHAPDFARARTDLVELGVAQISSGGIVVDIAVAAEKLNRIERDLGGVLGGVEDGTGGILARGLAAVTCLCHGIDVSLARVHPDIHVGDLALDQLKLPDRLSELAALVYVGRHDIHACLHDAERPGPRIGLGVDHQHLGLRAVGDPHLGAVEDEAVAMPLRAGLHRDDIGAGARLGHGE